MKHRAVTIEIPGRDRKDIPGYCEQHVDLRFLPTQALAARMLLDALRAQHAKMDNGRHVETTADTIRWLLDQLAKEYANGRQPESDDRPRRQPRPD